MQPVHEVDDKISVPERPAHAAIKVHGSRFLAEVKRVDSTDEAAAVLDVARRRERAATHVAAAWRITDAIYRTIDDKEPTGSAGRSILRQIDAQNLTRTLVVVTRWFGGTKLGVGGLRRAYGRAAAEALDAAGIRTEILHATVRLRFAYADTSKAQRVVRSFGARVIERNFQDEVTHLVAVRRSEAERFAEAFTDALAGRGRAAWC